MSWWISPEEEAISKLSTTVHIALVGLKENRDFALTNECHKGFALPTISCSTCLNDFHPDEKAPHHYAPPRK